MSKKEMTVDEMMEKAAEGKLSRRQFSQLLGAAGVSLVAMPMFSRSTEAAGEEAFYFTWGGYDVPELLGYYQEKHGALPDMAPYASSSEALTKVQAGFEVDVLHPCNTNIGTWIDAGVVQPFDLSKLPNWPDMIPSLTEIGHRGDDHYFAAMDWGQNSITYRTDLVDLKNGEESWGLLWDERYAGKIGILANEGDTWWCAAIYAGIPFEEIHTEENIEKVAELLRKQQPLVLAYYDDVTTMEQSLASGELVAAMTWNETPTRLKKEGVPVKFANPKEGALTWVCGAVIHAEAKHLDKAHDVINSLISPESGRFLIDDYGYGHSNTKAFDLVSEERLAELGLSRNPTELLQSGKYQTEMTVEFQSKTASLFSEIKAGF
ncbi:MAG: ABC transporter substrate-binding protein [Thalassospira sp.]|uniref:ABC transporter substrate-binding protein n=1 Tax=Thalassospira sp. TaxID=1912094 RepID=UPI003A843E5E